MQSADLMVQRGGRRERQFEGCARASLWLFYSTIDIHLPRSSQEFCFQAAPDVTHDLGKAGPFPEVGEVWEELEPGSRNEWLWSSVEKEQRSMGYEDIRKENVLSPVSLRPREHGGGGGTIGREQGTDT